MMTFFPDGMEKVVMHGFESWTIKNVECQRIDAFKLCWRRLLRVPWTARRSNQSILKEISPEYSLEGLMLNLKLQHFGHLMWKADSLEKTLMTGKIRAGGEEGDRGWDGWMASPTQWTWVWASSGRQWSTQELGLLQSMRLQRVRHNKMEKVLFFFPASLSVDTTTQTFRTIVICGETSITCLSSIYVIKTGILKLYTQFLWKVTKEA